jgi:hypothetical protein
MNTQHTPGPWHIVPNGRDAFNVSSFDYGRICTVHDPLAPEMARMPELEATARLIAAAPELLAALQLCVTKFSQLKDTEMTLGMARALEESHAAIAKAESK